MSKYDNGLEAFIVQDIYIKSLQIQSDLPILEYICKWNIYIWYIYIYICVSGILFTMFWSKFLYIDILEYMYRYILEYIYLYIFKKIKSSVPRTKLSS